jgi:cell division protein ZapA (FtsZ GTPase activity inhibitor)
MTKPMTSKKSVAVRIAGHEYKLLSDGDEELLRQIAKDVDRAMARVRERTGTVDTLDVAVLTCLNLAREIISLRDQRRGSIDDERFRGLIERIEAATEGLPASSAGKVSDPEPAARASKTKAGRRVHEPESPRTLDLRSDLPSVETLRDRTVSTSEPGAPPNEDAIPEARFASGGRERAS